MADGQNRWRWLLSDGPVIPALDRSVFFSPSLTFTPFQLLYASLSYLLTEENLPLLPSFFTFGASIF